MKLHLIPAMIIAFAVLLFSCQRNPGVLLNDNSDTLNIPGSQKPDQQVVAGLTGKILDEHGEPLKDAQVSAGGKSTFTDEFGVFRLADVTVSQQFTFVTATKNGYLSGSRTIISQSNGNGFLTIKLIPKKLTASFNSESGATITINPSSSIKFQPQSIITSSGEIYNGEVFVYTSVLDPTAEDFNQIMPGDLRGIRTDSQQVALRSFGMIHTLLETASGESLHLLKEKPAEMSMQVAASMVSKAPAEIPLWHFSEYDGKWREEGKAILKNGIYTGSVSHFSIWNYDQALGMVFITLKVQTANNNKLPYLRMKATDPVSGNYSEGYSDSTGSILLWAPKGVSVQMELFDECGGSLFSKTEGPLNADKDLGTYTVTPSAQQVTVKGKVIDCRLQPVSEAKVSLLYQGLNYTADAIDGDFEVNFNVCNSGAAQARLMVIDYATMSTSVPQMINITGNEIGVGAVKVCGINAEEYTYIQFDDDSILLTIPEDSIIYHTGNYPEITMMDKLPLNEHQFAINSILLYYTPQQYESSSQLTTITWKNRIYYPHGNIQYNILEFGQIGEIILYTFSGEVQWSNDPNDIHTVSGKVRYKRPF